MSCIRQSSRHNKTGLPSSSVSVALWLPHEILSFIISVSTNPTWACSTRCINSRNRLDIGPCVLEILNPDQPTRKHLQAQLVLVVTREFHGCVLIYFLRCIAGNAKPTKQRRGLKPIRFAVTSPPDRRVGPSKNAYKLAEDCKFICSRPNSSYFIIRQNALSLHFRRALLNA